MDMDLFSGVVHELVVCTTEYFPVTREGGMWDDEVACRITIGVSYFGVMDTDAIGRGGLGINWSTIYQRRGMRDNFVTSTTSSYAPCPSGMKWGLINELNLNHSHSLFVSFGKVSVTVPISVLHTSPG